MFSVIEWVRVKGQVASGREVEVRVFLGDGGEVPFESNLSPLKLKLDMNVSRNSIRLVLLTFLAAQ